MSKSLQMPIVRADTGSAAYVESVVMAVWELIGSIKPDMQRFVFSALLCCTTEYMDITDELGNKYDLTYNSDTKGISIICRSGASDLKWFRDNCTENMERQKEFKRAARAAKAR